MQPIQLTYTPDRGDFAALYALGRTPAAVRMVFFACVIAMSSALGWLNDHSALFAALSDWSPPWGQIATLFVMVVILYTMLMGLRRLSREIRAARAAARATPVTVTADGNSIAFADAGGTDAHPWSSVRDAWLGRSHVFLTLPGGRHVALPRRAFADDAAMQAFARAAEGRVHAASGSRDMGLAPAATPEGAR